MVPYRLSGRIKAAFSAGEKRDRLQRSSDACRRPLYRIWCEG
ncbi:hypothetical protein HMPREF1548_05723 [Clostridium sp. KLE 1755]|nr:hypothetical protein HMPREF1548_05723 [Clostridium sp. KLE 1755]